MSSKRLWTGIGVAAPVLAIGCTMLWFSQVRAVDIPENRALFVAGPSTHFGQQQPAGPPRRVGPKDLFEPRDSPTMRLCTPVARLGQHQLSFEQVRVAPH